MSVVWEEALDKERRAAGLGWRVPRHGHVWASTASKTSLLFASSSLSLLFIPSTTPPFHRHCRCL